MREVNWVGDRKRRKGRFILWVVCLIPMTTTRFLEVDVNLCLYSIGTAEGPEDLFRASVHCRLFGICLVIISA